MLPLRSRLGPVLALMMMAPVCAEYLSAYLPDTGDAVVMVGGLLVLGPLYGGAALLVREVALRTVRGWPGVLLLAAAFGVAMPTLVDLSAWTAHRPDVPYWDLMREPTLLAPLGLSVLPMLQWVTGHVLLSVAAPLVLLTALTPRHRGRPLLGRPGLAVVAALLVLVAALIRADPDVATAVSTVQQAWSATVVAALVVLGLSPLGAPYPRGGERRDDAPARCTPRRVLIAALPTALVLDLVPFGWGGTVGYATILVATAALVARAARRRSWGLEQVTALGVAVVLARVAAGFLSPLPPGVSPAAKTVQGVVLLALALAVCRTAWVRARAGETSATVPA